MSKGKYASKRSRSSKSLVLVLALVTLITATVGGTLAWLGDKTETVTNTFTASGIDIKLEEHVYDPNEHELTDTLVTTNNQNDDYVMVPGWDIPKDPDVTVKAGSEDCYVFVKVEKKNNFDTYMNYKIDARWTKLNSVTDADVYYMIYDSNDTTEGKPVMGTAYAILAGDKVTVKETIKDQDMKAVTANPSISFTAYAVQYYKNHGVEFKPDEAWTLAEGMAITTP